MGTSSHCMMRTTSSSPRWASKAGQLHHRCSGEKLLPATVAPRSLVQGANVQFAHSGKFLPPSAHLCYCAAVVLGHHPSPQSLCRCSNEPARHLSGGTEVHIDIEPDVSRCQALEEQGNRPSHRPFLVALAGRTAALCTGLPIGVVLFSPPAHSSQAPLKDDQVRRLNAFDGRPGKLWRAHGGVRPQQDIKPLGGDLAPDGLRPRRGLAAVDSHRPYFGLDCDKPAQDTKTFGRPLHGSATSGGRVETEVGAEVADVSCDPHLDKLSAPPPGPGDLALPRPTVHDHTLFNGHNTSSILENAERLLDAASESGFRCRII
eukprot:15462405-Alexandrium_andersonii.AAC.2